MVDRIPGSCTSLLLGNSLILPLQYTANLYYKPTLLQLLYYAMQCKVLQLLQVDCSGAAVHLMNSQSGVLLSQGIYSLSSLCEHNALAIARKGL